jgi:hypothetical protein
VCAFHKRYELVSDCIKTYNAVKPRYGNDVPLPARVVKEGLHLARILFLPDKAGKTRVVYCLTWWFQELLESFHKDLYKILYSIKQDGTRNHSEAAAVVKGWTAEGRKLHSVDLTNATDRFPLWLQYSVVKGLKGQIAADLWKEVISIPAYSPHHGTVRYGIGQPMGAKTSWAIFALTHHTVLRVICRLHRVSDDCYVIIGDNIVISDDKVALSYKAFLSDIGVPYSPKKTIDPSKVDGSAAEFAKRIFSLGMEYSPLTSSLLERVYKHRSYAVFLSVFRELEVKWGCKLLVDNEELHLHPPVSYLFKVLPKPWQDKFTVYWGTLGRGIKPSEEGYDIQNDHVVRLPNPWKDIDDQTYLMSLGTEIATVIQGYLGILIEIRGALKGGPMKDLVLGAFVNSKYHPLQRVLARLEEVVTAAARKMDTGELALSDVLDLGLDLSYLHSLTVKPVSWEKHLRLLERRDRANMKFWDNVYWYTQNPDDMYT